MSRNGIIVLAIVIMYCVVATIILLYAMHNVRREPNSGTVSAVTANDEIERTRAENCFSYTADATSDIDQTVNRRREAESDILGPIVPVDCSRTQRYCLDRDNCRLFCKDASVIEFDCLNGICVQRAVDKEKPTHNSSDGGSKCDTKNGEYGLLVGYNEIGVAMWECVQLYPAWQNRSSYCENGTIDLDVRKREPSYRDCTCRSSDVRIVYRYSILGQSVNGLPHCVSSDRYKFYELSYRQI